MDSFVENRRKIAHRRHELLEGIPEITLPYEPPDCVHSFYLYTCLVCKEWQGEKRDQMVRMLNDEFGAGAVVANPPVYESRRFLREHTPGQSLPQSEELGRRLLCLAIHPSMTEEENEYCAASLIEAVERLR